MIYWHIFLAFFIPGIVGYGGGPSSIPLIQNEVVDRYRWMTVEQFSEVLALANALPGPIATKMAGYIGFEQGGLLGSFIAVFATVAPSLILMLTLLGLLYKFKDSPKVKRMTTWVRPTIAVLLGVLTYRFFFSSYQESGVGHTLLLVVISFIVFERTQINPVFIILGALGYGAIFLS